jgi:ribonuclease P protein component
LGFPKASRLLKRHEFLRVQQGGKRHDLGLVLAFVLPREMPALRVGLTTSRKVGCAVFRNRIRRLMREAVRRLLLPHPLPFDVVLVAKQGLDPAISQEKIDQLCLRLLRRLRS